MGCCAVYSGITLQTFQSIGQSPWWWWQQTPLKHRLTSTITHGVKTQRTRRQPTSCSPPREFQISRKPHELMHSKLAPNYNKSCHGVVSSPTGLSPHALSRFTSLKVENTKPLCYKDALFPVESDKEAYNCFILLRLTDMSAELIVYLKNNVFF